MIWRAFAFYLMPLVVGTFIIFELTYAHNDCHATLLRWKSDYHFFPREP